VRRIIDAVLALPYIQKSSTKGIKDVGFCPWQER